MNLPEPALSQPMSEHDGDGGPVIDFYTADQMLAVILEERERCAKLCEDGEELFGPTCHDIARAIRKGAE